MAQRLAIQNVAEPNPLDTSGLCLLSLDGGGVRGLSTLYILKVLMTRLNGQRHEAALSPVKPFEVFDLIGGTGTGGLIAIMLGRLEMDVDECITAYIELTKAVFEKKLNKLPVNLKGDIKPQFDIGSLQSVVKKLITGRGIPEEAMLNDGTERGCRTFVCTTSHETKGIRRLRSYTPRDELDISATICEAVLATSAATNFFDAVHIGARKFVAGSLGANNPVNEVEDEASNIWSSETADLQRQVKCFVSVGTGHPGKKAIEDKMLGFLSKTLKELATETERTADRFVSRWRHAFDKDRYFRFNVQQGLQDVGLAEYHEQGLIEAATEEYTRHQEQKSRMRQCISNLMLKRERTMTSFAQALQEYDIRSVVASQSTVHEVCWNVPFERNPRFVGRGAQLDRLENSLFAEKQSRKTAIAGLGGVGKTHVALEMAYRMRERYPECSICWIPATSLENIQQAYLDIGQRLRIPGIQDNQAHARTLVQNHLSQKKANRWLFILDNVDDMDIWIHGLKDYLPKSQQGRILLTTRNREIAVKFTHQQNVIELAEMDRETAMQLLATSLPHLEFVKCQQDALRVLEQLTFLPLAIVQAGAYIYKNGITLSDYLSLLDTQEQHVISLLSEDFEDEGRYNHAIAKNPIASTWLISFDQIRHHHPRAAEYLSFLSCVSPKAIPQSILPPAPTHKEQIDAIGTLIAYSFVSRQAASQLLNVHRLVHLATRNWLGKEGKLTEWETNAVARLEEVFPSDDHANRGIWRAYLPHAQYVLIATLNGSDVNVGLDLRHRVGLCLLEEGRFSEAHDSLRLVLEGRENTLRQEHAKTLASMNDLAWVLIKLGNYIAAEELCWKSLEGCERALGENHPETIKSMTSLASAMKSQGRYDVAEEMYRRELAGAEKSLGKEHPDTLNVVNNLALVLGAQGKYEEAMEMSRRAVERSERARGEHHPATLAFVSVLAWLQSAQGNYKTAEGLNRRALESREEALGKDHPDTLESAHNLAIDLWSQHQHEDALALLERAKTGGERVLGPEHPDTILYSRNYATLQRKMLQSSQA